MRGMVVCASFLVISPINYSKAALPSDAALPKGALARLGSLRYQAPTANRKERFYIYDQATALSPDGKTIAISGAYGDKTSMYFMNSADGRIRRNLTVRNLYGRRLQYLPNGKEILLWGWSGVKLFDSATGKTTWSKEGLTESAMAISHDGKWIATQPNKLVYHAPVIIIDAKTGKTLRTLPGKGSSCQALAFGPKGERLLLHSTVPNLIKGKSISFGSDSKIILACIDVTKGKVIGEIEVNAMQAVALGPDGETIAVEDRKHRNIRILHLPTGRVQCVVPEKKASLAFSPNGKTLLTLNKQGRAITWNAATGRKIRDLEGRLIAAYPRIIGMSNDGTTIAVFDGDWRSAKSIVVWNAATGRRTSRLVGHHGAVTCLAYTASGKRLASGSADRTVHIWNPITRVHLKKLAEHPKAVTAVAFSSDEKLLASGSEDGEVQVTNLANGKRIAKFAAMKSAVRTLAFASKSNVLFIGGAGAQMIAWNIAAGKVDQRWNTGANSSVLAFTDGGELALTTTAFPRFFNDKGPPERLHVWNPFRRRKLASMHIRPDEKGHFGTVLCKKATFSPDGRMIATSQITEMQGIRPSYGFARLCLWERSTGEEFLRLGQTITEFMAFSPNGRFLATGRPGKSGHLRVGYGAGVDVWDVVHRKKIGGLDATPQCLAFSPDGRFLATGGGDNCILIWKAPQSLITKKGRAPTVAEQDAQWAALGSHAKEAYKAMSDMMKTPDQTVALLKKRIQPVRLADPKQVARLIKKLDSDVFIIRNKAQAALEKMGEGAAPIVKKALQGKITLELNLRLRRLLKTYDTTNPASILGRKQHRAVDLLEWIGTPAARDVLRSWTKGVEGARLVNEANAALKRLGES